MNYKLDIKYSIIASNKVAAQITLSLPTRGKYICKELVSLDTYLLNEYLDDNWGDLTEDGNYRFRNDTLTAQSWEQLNLKIDVINKEIRSNYQNYSDLFASQPADNIATITL
jgi:hypothetical protein